MSVTQRELEDWTRLLLMDRSVSGRVGTTMPPLDVPEQELPTERLLRGGLEMPEVAEGEIVRYFSTLSQFNFSIDHNFYPLGSCTMKYNPSLTTRWPPCRAYRRYIPCRRSPQCRVP